jgi:hypothetical protein
METKELFPLATLLARLSYKSDTRIKQEIEANNLSLVAIHDIKNKYMFKSRTEVLKFYIADDLGQGIRYFLIRGSAGNFNNWLNNLFAFNTDKNELGEVHSGFWSEAMSIWDTMKQYQDFSKEQILIGHSKGSALAHLIAPLLKADISVGIASPFFATREYVNNAKKTQFKTIYYDIIHNLDIVPIVTYPLFTPIGDVYYIDRNDNLILNPSTVRNISDTIISFLIKRYKDKQTLHDMLFYHCYTRYEEFFKVNHRKVK